MRDRISCRLPKTTQATEKSKIEIDVGFDVERLRMGAWGSVVYFGQIAREGATVELFVRTGQPTAARGSTARGCPQHHWRIGHHHPPCLPTIGPLHHQTTAPRPWPTFSTSNTYSKMGSQTDTKDRQFLAVIGDEVRIRQPPRRCDRRRLSAATRGSH